MRNGQPVIDADTHFQPSAESILPYLDGEYRSRIQEFEQFKSPVKVGRAGQILQEPYRHWLRFRGGGEGGRGWGGNGPRVLGQAGPTGEERAFQSFMGTRYPTVGTEDFDIDTRIKEMNEEGVDIEIMVCSAFGGHEDPLVDVAFTNALHRYLDDVCNRYPGRLKAILQITGRAVQASVEEMEKWANADWAVAVQVNLPRDLPLDHPDLEPIWAQAQRQDLCVVHHSSGTGYPGERDLWDNPFLGRLASHPWGAMRSVAAFFGAGIMDRYPNLRLAILESGFGWLPFWGKRMDDQVHYMGYVADIKQTMWDYLTGGRFYAGIVIHEGEDMVKVVNQTMGDHVLMFGSDYPHAESRFPDSVDIVQKWDLGEDSKRKLFWGNAARCFRLEGA